MKKIVKSIQRACSWASIHAIYVFRPFFGPAICRFYPSCTAYAIKELETTSFFKAWARIAFRVLLCNPLTPKACIEKICNKQTHGLTYERA